MLYHCNNKTITTVTCCTTVITRLSPQYHGTCVTYLRRSSSITAAAWGLLCFRWNLTLALIRATSSAPFGWNTQNMTQSWALRIISNWSSWDHASIPNDCGIIKLHSSFKVDITYLWMILIARSVWYLNDQIWYHILQNIPKIKLKVRCLIWTSGWFTVSSNMWNLLILFPGHSDYYLD